MKRILWILYCVLGALLIIVSIPLRNTQGYEIIGMIARVAGSIMLFVKIGIEIGRKPNKKA